jgi:low affinity Fe/Cu permease
MEEPAENSVPGDGATARLRSQTGRTNGQESPRGLAPKPVQRTGRHWSSRLLHFVGEITSHSATGLVVAALVAAWVVFGIASAFPGWWDNVLFVASSTITLFMVFAIQHTQARQQAATQRKLDELLRAIPRADERLIAVEEAPDGELEALAGLNLEDRERALESAAEQGIH